MSSPSDDSKLAKLYCIQPVYGESVGIVDTATVGVDVSNWVDTIRATPTRVRRAKNEDRFYPILILNLLLYVAYITPPHRHNLQQNAFLP